MTTAISTSVNPRCLWVRWCIQGPPRRVMQGAGSNHGRGAPEKARESRQVAG
jgi:hypothetical protein